MYHSSPQSITLATGGGRYLDEIHALSLDLEYPHRVISWDIIYPNVKASAEFTLALEVDIHGIVRPIIDGDFGGSVDTYSFLTG